MKTLQINDDDYLFLKELANNLKTQDNRITSDPIFLVQECVKEPVPDDIHSDGYYFIENITGDYCVYKTIFEAYRNLLEYGYEKETIRGQVETVAYRNVWHTVQSCFTEHGAENFIKRKNHDYGELRIYVNSLYYNYEMKNLRNILLNLTLTS